MVILFGQSYLYQLVGNIYPYWLIASDMFNFFFLLFIIDIFLFFLLSEPLDAGDEDRLDERDQHGKDEPGLNPLDIRGLGQLLDNTDEEGGGSQHQCNVYGDGSVEEIW